MTPHPAGDKCQTFFKASLKRPLIQNLLAIPLIYVLLKKAYFWQIIPHCRFGRKVAIWVSSVTMLVFGVITSFVPWYPVFVFTWWVTGTMAIACYTAAFVWTMEIAAGKWKIYLGMSMNYSWPTCRLIIAGAH